MNKSAKLAELRHFMARYGLPPERTPISLGEPSADAVLGGGLKPGALHEVLAKGWSAGGFAVAAGDPGGGLQAAFLGAAGL